MTLTPVMECGDAALSILLAAEPDGSRRRGALVETPALSENALPVTLGVAVDEQELRFASALTMRSETLVLGGIPERARALEAGELEDDDPSRLGGTLERVDVGPADEKAAAILGDDLRRAEDILAIPLGFRDGDPGNDIGGHDVSTSPGREEGSMMARGTPLVHLTPSSVTPRRRMI